MHASTPSGPGTYDETVGWVALKGFLSPSHVAQICADCDQLLALPAHARRPRDKPHSGTHHLVELDGRSRVVAAVLDRTELTSIVAQILGPVFVLDTTGYRSPQPSFGGQKLHADDAPMLHPAPASVATAIIALTDFTVDNGATRVVPGSHLRPDLQRSAGSLESHPDEFVLTGAAGTAFVFTGHILHSGTSNRSSSGRPALQVTWRAGPRSADAGY